MERLLPAWDDVLFGSRLSLGCLLCVSGGVKIMVGDVWVGLSLIGGGCTILELLLDRRD